MTDVLWICAIALHLHTSSAVVNFKENGRKQSFKKRKLEYNAYYFNVNIHS